MIEQQIEQSFIDKLVGLKYEYRQDITDRATLEQNFREKFDALNRVRLTDSEFARLLDEIATPDIFTAAKTLLCFMPLFNVSNCNRMIFDGEQLSDLMAPLDLGWKARASAETALMKDLHPLLTKRAGSRDISGLSAYE